MGFPHSSVGKESTCSVRDPSSIPGWGRSAGEGIGYSLQYSWASLVAQLVKSPPALQKTWVDPWVGKIPWRRERLSTLVFWPGEFHGLYSPWGCKERKDTVLSPFKWKLTSRNAPLFPNLFCGVCMGVQEQGVVSRSEIEEGRPKVLCNQNDTPLNKL